MTGSISSGRVLETPVLAVHDVSKWYRQVEAVSHVSFAAAQGEFISLLGPSGCGKTTTLRMIAGLERPNAGSISLEGRDVTGVPPFRRNTPMVWQSFALIPHLDVCGNVEFGLKMRGIRATERRRRAFAMLEAVGLLDLVSRPVDQLSSGQKQRVGLARALIMEPRLLLLDEPLAALDANLRVRMQSELLRIQRQFNITFLFVTHSQSEALSMSDRIIVMNRGRIEQIDSPQTIYRRPKTRFVAEFIGNNNMITGDVREARDGIIDIASPAGPLVSLAPAPARRVVVIVPADCVAVVIDKESVEQGPSPRTEIRATHTGTEFHGSLVTLFFQLLDGTSFRVEKHGTALAAWDLAPGREYVLAWNPQDAFLLAEE